MSDNSSCIERLPAVIIREPDPNSAYSDYWTILLPFCEDWEMETQFSSDCIPKELQKTGQPIWIYHGTPIRIEARQHENDAEEQAPDGDKRYGT